MFQTVLQETMQQNPVVMDAIEGLNSEGLASILDRAAIIRPVGPMSSSVNWPKTRQGEPLSNFENGIILSPNGYANGHFRQIIVLNQLVAELTGCPVVGKPTPSREQGAFHDITPVKGWYSMNRPNRLQASISIYDNYARKALESLYTLLEADGGDGIKRLSALGGSLGSVTSLALMYQAGKNADLGGLSVYAVPNTQYRSVYKQLLLRDFLRSTDLDGGVRAHAMAGNPRYEALYQSLGFSDDIPHSRRTDVVMAARYFFHDMLGGYDLSNFRANEAFSRALAVPSAFEMIKRIMRRSKLPVMNLLFFEEDPVAPPLDEDTWKQNGIFAGSGVSLEKVPGVDHAACQNPYIVGHAALKLVA